jgi:hypothetical protein
MEAIAPLLLESGAAPLAWRQIRNSSLATDPVTRTIQDTYRLAILQQRVWTNAVRQVARFFESRNIDAVMVKGWAIARLYPEPAVRLFGDVDLVVRPEWCEAAVATQADPERPEIAIDLDWTLRDVPGRRFDDFFSRSITLKLDDASIRTPGPEDHLKLVAIHMMRHGAPRPTGLVDVAILAEAADEHFDWEYCMRGTPAAAGWLLGALGLASRVLGADLSRTPYADAAERLPRWAYPALIRQWGRPHYMNRGSMSAAIQTREGVVRSILERWPNPIQATVRMGAAFGNRPRWPYQLGEFLKRAVRFGISATR